MNSFPEKPTTHDLSDTKELKKFPSFDSSMAGSNMITDKSPDFAGRGTPSEASQDVVGSKMTDFGDSHPTPVLPGPEAVGDSALGVDEKGSGYSPAAHSWKGCH